MKTDKFPTGYLGKAWNNMTNDELILAIKSLWKKYKYEEAEKERYLQMMFGQPRVNNQSTSRK